MVIVVPNDWVALRIKCIHCIDGLSQLLAHSKHDIDGSSNYCYSTDEEIEAQKG